MEITLEEKIEVLRNKMIQEAYIQGNLLHEKVLALSQELDSYLVYYQKLMRKNERKKLHFPYSRTHKLVKAPFLFYF